MVGVWVVGPALFVFLGSVVGGVSGGAGDGELDFGCKIRNSLLTAEPAQNTFGVVQCVVWIGVYSTFGCLLIS